MQDADPVPQNDPTLVTILNLAAFISIAAGIYAFFSFFPEKLGYGESWKPIAYLPSTAFLAAGFAQALLLGALGQIISYLAIMAHNKQDHARVEGIASGVAGPGLVSDEVSYERRMIEEHGIRKVGNFYHISGYDYDNLSEAVSHALNDRARRDK